MLVHPSKTDLAVVTCYFNPMGWKSRIKNFRAFYAALRSQGVDPYVVEASITGEFEVPDGPRIKRVQMRDVVWQKERLLNIAINNLPPHYQKVAWLDCDLLFDEPDWHKQVVKALDEYPVVQCFKYAYWLSQYGVPEGWLPNPNGPGIGPIKRYSMATRHKETGKFNLGKGHPGFAWAARLDVIRALGGLLDTQMAGSGDVAIALGFYGITEHEHLTNYSPSMVDAIHAWGKEAYKLVQGNVNYVPCVIRHLWHGTRWDRKYDPRHAAARTLNFDPTKHLSVNEDGCYEWSDDVPEGLPALLSNYFKARQEDYDGRTKITGGTDNSQSMEGDGTRQLDETG